jgi:hypothetical protein
MTDWNSSQTIVFIIGILEWEDKDSFPSMSVENRKDEELMKFFLAAGVPDKHVHYYCDKEAVTNTVSDDLKYYVSRADENDTLFFYYLGLFKNNGPWGERILV